MKKYISSILFGTCLLAFTSCKKYLDINTNPNQATSSTPTYVLPNALAVTASSTDVTYHNYGAQTVGYEVNAGGYGGWGTIFTYNYSTSEQTGLWTSMYNNLRDYQYILSQTEGVATSTYFNAAARIMKAYDFQLLVDQYGDIPYSEALQGADFLTPKYDKAEAIYQDLIVQLNKAIADINAADEGTQLNISSADIMFHGDMQKWKQLANTIKLRILIRASGSSLSSYVTTQLGSFNTADGFLNDDAIINPGYIVTDGKQNPIWNTYHSNAGGTQSGFGRQFIPSTYVLQFYNGGKLTDDTRADLTYYHGVTVPNNQLGNDATPPNAPSGTPAWYIGGTNYANAPNTVGVLKGRTMGSPLFLAAESHFLLAEAALKGYALAGTAQANFDAGIAASFAYLEKDVSGSIADNTPQEDATAYQLENAGAAKAYLANYNLAATNEQRLEAIITQKYIALNFIHGHEAWNEYRRTGYPVTTGTAANTSFASVTSQSTRTDRLPVRVQYPSSEYTYNPGNVPSGINVYTSRLFWDAN
ncbi:SusD/RagB family nutrient-binding outer membrane lipoprotein [Mucilaginibacter psychrotolerans]|uniref:SusD/RagB family nutrient-binding outer membrane lipoprotein n=1 Tax=Mucilaginibacter psychrotolerans TaxID=1524096 RepID=A0A4Y8SNL7_9SPHI|nr:SusD/RagB family nutrient-binding outer membrane lipoprotein [Mucilaginibacter psychrotolerans]TFF40157.1 SusD/RagB family nutrient-binding outer membrane lipoprotein [Mucilaginibacter psychrotolerans]